MSIDLSAAHARHLDETDDLLAYREQFVHHDPDLIYLDGNSLGRLPTATKARLQEAIEQEWGDRLIRSWNEGWLEAPNRIGDKIGRLLGARPGELTMADSTSVNLFKLVLAALDARPGRFKIITDNLNFPSDHYILQGIVRLLGNRHEIVVVPSADDVHGPVDGLTAAIDEDTALVTLSHTVFKSGYSYDMDAITTVAHEAGAIILWDLSHSAGAVPVDLNGANVDLAVGCTYKYLNGGPGAPAFLYVADRWHDRLRNPLSGWIGQANLFDFDLTYAPAPGIQQFLTGTPPILSLTAVEPGIDMLLEIGMDRVRDRSVRLSNYLVALWQARLEPLGYRLNSPANHQRRGSHISLGHDDGARIARVLIDRLNVLPDFRQPDNIRLGLSPLYNTFSELHEAVERMALVVEQGLYREASVGDRKVT